MSDPKNVDEAPKPAPEKGDELLRRMLKTPPKPHKTPVETTTTKANNSSSESKRAR